MKEPSTLYSALLREWLANVDDALSDDPSGYDSYVRIGARWEGGRYSQRFEEALAGLDRLEQLERCNAEAPGSLGPPVRCDRWPGHDGPHRTTVNNGEWGEGAGRLDV